MKIIKGDLIKLAKEGHFDVICHGCNCFATWGAGIALQMKKAFPDAYKADCDEPKILRKLGRWSVTIIEQPTGPLTILNLYTQYNYGTDKINCDYQAIRDCFRGIKRHFSGLRIAYPKIGAGLAGGNWQVISAIIDGELAGENHTLVEYQKG